MFSKLFILFTIIPIAELYLLIKIGGMIGAFNTVLIILFTAVIGAYLAKTQGFVVVRKINQALNEGRIPAQELLDGLFVLLGGFTLLTPGFLTDFIGLSMLFPLTRILYIKLAVRIIQNKIEAGQWRIHR
ncbi:MAG: membrane protein FxsA [Nitrospirota bacterium]|nr:membrane protein FxsA [Nitrospirota bacterium]MDH5768582.1 membrane protein FxsA [Nitrospirota bacterium]